MNHLLGSAVAFAVGLGVVFLGDMARTPPPAPISNAATPPTRPVPTWVRTECPKEADNGALIDELTSELDQKQRLLSAAWAREEVYSGAPVDWPDGVDAQFTEEAVITFLEASVAESGGVVLGYDCGEYPCVATIGWQQYADAHPGMDLISDGYPGGHGGTSMPPHRDDDGRSYVQARAFGPYDEDLDENAIKRLQFRIRESMSLNQVPEDW